MVFPEQAGLRLDQLLAAATLLSRRRARALIAQGAVWRNGRAVRVASRAVEVGDALDLVGVEEELGVPRRPELPPVVIRHEDRFLLVVDKPAGVLSQPAEHRQPGELAMDERLLLNLAAREGRRPYLRLLHRLDRVTSGLLLFARSPAALKPLSEAWRRGRVERLYLAVVEGEPAFEERRLEASIGRDPSGAWRFQVTAAGRPAVTEIRVRSRGRGFALVECRLATGRTHQVRVHLAHLGLPVAGDRLYGAAILDAPRPLLHAAELALPHPEDGRRLRVTSPLPPELEPYLPASPEEPDAHTRSLHR